MKRLRQSGQATVEYIFILAFAIFLGLKVTNQFTQFFQDTMGSVAHVLSTNLIVGACKDNCFFSGYANGFNE